MDLDLIKFLKLAVECNVYVDPIDPGLSFEELIEIGNRFGRQAGEITDHIDLANSDTQLSMGIFQIETQQRFGCSLFLKRILIIETSELSMLSYQNSTSLLKPMAPQEQCWIGT